MDQSPPESSEPDDKALGARNLNLHVKFIRNVELRFSTKQRSLFVSSGLCFRVLQRAVMLSTVLAF
eukprot:scaffold9322_cov168-Amphora_coffeaeformis.AAC.3